MEKTITPEESFLVITKTIEETRERFKVNGHVFVFWGALVVIVFGSQMILSLLELYGLTIYPIYLFPLVGGGYMLYLWIQDKKKNIPKTIIGRVLGNIGWVVGMNLLVMGFFFWNQIGEAMAPIFLILLALMIIVSGLSINYRPLAIGGALVNLIGLGSFLLDRQYHGFSMMAGAVAGMIIPGILLNNARRKENV